MAQSVAHRSSRSRQPAGGGSIPAGPRVRLKVVSPVYSASDPPKGRRPQIIKGWWLFEHLFLRRLVRRQKQYVTELCQMGYPTSEPLDIRQDPIEMQVWEDIGLEHQVGAISPGILALVTNISEIPDEDEDMDIPTASRKHASISPKGWMMILHQLQRSKPQGPEGNMNFATTMKRFLVLDWKMICVFQMMRMIAFLWSAPIAFRRVTHCARDTTLSLTRGPAGMRTTTGSLSAPSRTALY